MTARRTLRTYCHDDPGCIGEFVHSGPHRPGCRGCGRPGHTDNACPDRPDLQEDDPMPEPRRSIIPPVVLPIAPPRPKAATFEDQCITVSGHIPVAFVPTGINDTCATCYRSFAYGQWGAELPETQRRDGHPFLLCRVCITAIAAAAPQMPANPAPDPLDC